MATQGSARQTDWGRAPAAALDDPGDLVLVAGMDVPSINRIRLSQKVREIGRNPGKSTPTIACRFEVSLSAPAVTVRSCKATPINSPGGSCATTRIGGLTRA